MPDYKKKNIKKITKDSKRPKKKIENSKKAHKVKPKIPTEQKMEIEYFDEKKKEPKKRISAPKNQRKKINTDAVKETALKVIEGGRSKMKKRQYMVMSIALMIVVVLLLFHALTPTGIIEYIGYAYASTGSGDAFGSSLMGDDFYKLSTKGGNVEVLSDLYFEFYTDDGQCIMSEQHSFSNPEMENTTVRNLIYDRGSTGVIVYNCTSELYNKDLKNNIISATIADDGTMAFATECTGYAGKVDVYSKTFEKLFTWKSSVNMITDVAVSDDGNYTAVSTVNSTNGLYETVIYIFDGDDGEPEYKVKISGCAVSALETSANEGFFALCGSNACFVTTDGELNKLKLCGNVLYHNFNNDDEGVIVAARDDNSNESTAYIYESDGTLLRKINIDGVFKGASFDGDYLYCLLGSRITVFDENGKKTGFIECGYNTPLITAMNSEIVYIQNGKLMSFEAD